MAFFHTLTGMYLTQSVLHAFLGLIVVEISFFAWGISDHLSRFRYRLLTLTLPIFMFPLYQLLSPERSSWHFRVSRALFDSHQWLDLKAFSLFPFAGALIVILTGFSLLFLLQEVWPLFQRHKGRSSGQEYEETHLYDERMHTLLGSICRPLTINMPSYRVIVEELPTLFTQGFKSHTIVISDHLVRTLDDDQLLAALTHEVVHMIRGSSLKTPVIYLLRMLMFYNPVSLVEFRRIVHDEEFICDAITISMTKNPTALIEALKAFYYDPDEEHGNPMQMKDRVEIHSHNLILDERIGRLQGAASTGESGFRWLPFMLTACFIMTTGYLVV
ncbi:MAG: hypothetical protein EPN25_13805 [Nitrospirae bacterium]|nr:MAG: hypothetical protein EPN25_13805 [Nitrospirota bacterium]